MRMKTSFREVSAQLQAGVADVTGFAISDCDVLAIDMENIGTGQVTGLEIHGRIGRDAPFRNITPASFTALSYDVLKESESNPISLAAGGYAQFAINVSTYESVKLRASGATAMLRIHAAGYSED